MTLQGAKERLLQVASLVALVIAWEVLAQALDVAALPPASEVVTSLVELFGAGEALGPLVSTLRRTVLGFLVAFVAGLLYGIAANLFPSVATASRPLFDIVLFTPTLVIIFLGLIMLGRNDLTVVIVVGLVVSTTIGTYMRDALRDFDRGLASMAMSYKASLAQRVRSMYLPYLIPSMLAAGRIGFSLAWKVAFLSEVFGFSEGLGWRLRRSYEIYDMSGLLAWLTLFVITLLLVEQLIRTTERRVVKW